MALQLYMTLMVIKFQKYHINNIQDEINKYFFSINY